MLSSSPSLGRSLLSPSSVHCPPRSLPLTPRRTLTIHTRTLLSPTPSSLSSLLSSLPRPSPSSATLYLLPLTLPPAHLPPLLDQLQRLPHSLGSFAQPPHTPTHTHAHALSIARFVPDGGRGEAVRAWRSELRGRKGVQVGRWYVGEERDRMAEGRGKRVGEMQEVLSRGAGVEGGAGGEGRGGEGRGGEGWEGMWVPERGEVGRIDQLEGFAAQSVITLADGAPRPVLAALDGMFPHAAKLGLLSAPTPFLTGRPHTLFLGSQVHSAGSVGLALTSRLECEVEYGLEPLSPAFTVGSAQGNMLLSLAGSPNANPTQTLLAALQARQKTLGKDEDFYVGFPGSGGGGGGGGGGRVVKILSGDPSRGAMSLDMEEPMTKGEVVQFMHRPSPISPPPRSGMAGEMVFCALEKRDEVGEVDDEAPALGEPHVLDGFVGASEEGFIHSLLGEGGSAACTVPGGYVRARVS